MNKKIFYRIINILCLVVLVGTIVWLVAIWDSIPDEIATHFDYAGNPDSYGAKTDIIVIPIFSWLLYGMMMLVELIPGAWNTGVKVTPENSERVYGIIKSMIVFLKLYIVILFTIITVFSALSQRMPVWLLPVELVVIFGTIIVSVVRLYRAR